MSAPVKSPGTGAFGIEKLVVVVTATGALLLGAIHATGWILAVATGNPTPAFTPGRALAALGLNAYVPGVPPVLHALLLLVVAALVTVAVARVARHRRYRAAAPKRRAASFDTRDGGPPPRPSGAPPPPPP